MRHVRGFSLLELMVAVVVVGILAAIAYPTYTGYMQRSRRSEAQQLVVSIANREGQYLLDSRMYTNVIGATGLNANTERFACTPTAAPTLCSNPYYDITVTPNNGATPPEFIVNAVAKGSQATDGDLSLNHTGVKVRRVGTGPNLGW
jgi:type IV pilus assembly protein PilE